MTLQSWPVLLLVFGLSVASGVGDSHGFVHASRIWQAGKLVPGELGKSALGFAVGIGCYWVCTKYLPQLGVLTPETQTLLWFGFTLLGVGILSGRILRWPAVDQAVGAAVVLGLGWLLWRTGE